MKWEWPWSDRINWIVLDLIHLDERLGHWHRHVYTADLRAIVNEVNALTELAQHFSKQFSVTRGLITKERNARRELEERVARLEELE